MQRNEGPLPLLVCRHGSDESMFAVSCLNDVFTGVAVERTNVHALGIWGVDIFVQKDENHHVDILERKRLLMLR